MAETKFVIQGRDYPVPTLDTFDMDECELLYEKTGLTLQDVMDDEFELKLSPGLLRTLMLVTFLRGNPATRREQAEKIIGKIKAVDALEHLSAQEDDADPPAATATNGSPQRSHSSSPSSGADSPTGSDGRQASPQPDRTGTPGSDTQPGSDPVMSAGSLR